GDEDEIDRLAIVAASQYLLDGAAVVIVTGVEAGIINESAPSLGKRLVERVQHAPAPFAFRGEGDGAAPATPGGMGRGGAGLVLRCQGVGVEHRRQLHVRDL